MFGIRRPNFFRGLMLGEVRLAQKVFHATLPPSFQIGITNGLNGEGGIWTVDRSWGDYLQGAPEDARSPLKYLMNFGDAASWDLSSKGRHLFPTVPGAGTAWFSDNVLMHEMTHVWQFYHNGASAISGLRCLYAQSLGAGYARYETGEPFFDYNLEQRAMIVERWNEREGKEDDELFPYIHYLIRKEGQYRFKNNLVGLDELGLMDLAQLKVLLMMERMPEKVERSEPIRITARDDSLIRIPGDTLFDFDQPRPGKFDVRPDGDQALRQAATTILRSASSTRRLDRILINGHTDSIGEPAYNMALSERRAEAVARWFSSHGYIPRSIIRVQGFGQSQPVASNSKPDGSDDPIGRAKNRRVEIYVVNK